jgi:uncharacterized membrane protein YdbT with pleckstrin-like domain
VASLDLPWFAPPEILSLKVATFKGGRSKQGFIRRKTMELMLNKVDSLGIDQGLLGRAFNFGTVRVAVATEKQSFKFLENPLEFRRQVQLMQTKTQPTQ